jgi:hypothetical protein
VKARARREEARQGEHSTAQPNRTWDASPDSSGSKSCFASHRSVNVSYSVHTDVDLGVVCVTTRGLDLELRFYPHTDTEMSAVRKR